MLSVRNRKVYHGDFTSSHACSLQLKFMHWRLLYIGMFNSRAYVINFVWRSGYAKSTCMFLFLPLHAFIYGCTMQNDLTTVEPPISVTAVSISDDNCFQSPFFSDLLVGVLTFCQQFWKFRLRNKWNASFRVEIFWSKHRLPKLCFEFIGLPVVKVVHFHRWSSLTGRSDPIEICCSMSKNSRFHLYFAKQ